MYLCIWVTESVCLQACCIPWGNDTFPKLFAVGLNVWGLLENWLKKMDENHFFSGPELTLLFIFI